MSLIKSILLGSAAGIVAVASAQAADLPTRKAAPVEQYVKICNVGGITGWTLPGSDTCVKLSGFITAQFEGGNLSNQYNYAGSILSTQAQALDPYATARANQTILVQGGDSAAPIYNAYTGQPIYGPGTSQTYYRANGLPLTLYTPGSQLTLPPQKNNIFNRNATGWSTRANFGFDFASNTAYGPLIGHFDINANSGGGFDPVNGVVVNTAYLTWAGITAGVAQSFYSFVGGGDNWANMFSPDRKGSNEPNLLAYTASFGGGFSATLSAESAWGNNNGSGTQMTGASGSNPGSITFGGTRWPDIVGALHVKQGWGEAQVSGVLHQVDVKDYTYYNTIGTGLVTGLPFAYNGSENKTGFGIDAGVSFNLPWSGAPAKDTFLVTGAYSQNAVWYSGLPDGMWGENGQTNGNGQPMYMADAYFNPLTNSWAKPTAWSVSAQLEHWFTPAFYVDLIGSVGGLNWSDQNGYNTFLYSPLGRQYGYLGTGEVSPHATSWIVGADLGWTPVTNLNFDLELMYQATTQERPSGFVGTVYNTGAFVPGAWEGNSSGFAGRLRITRYF